MLDDLERRSPAVLREVLEHYVKAVPDEIRELRTAVEQRDADQMSARAHDLAGVAKLVGASELARALHELERLAPPLDGRADASLARVETAHREVLDALAARRVL